MDEIIEHLTESLWILKKKEIAADILDLMGVVLASNNYALDSITFF